MDIVTKKQNLLNLWLESFVVLNQCFGKLIKAALGLLILVVLVVSACAYTLGLTSQLTQIVLSILNVFCVTVLLQIITAHILQSQQPLMETFAGSVWPTIFQLISSFILALACLPIGLVCFPIMMLSPILGVICIIASMFLFVRFLYSFLAIAVDNKGPIAGLIYSWKLTGGQNYIDVLLVLLILIVSYLLIVIFFTLLGIAFRTLIPLYFANSFDLTHLSPLWWIVGAILVILYLFYHLALLTFLLLVFLNRKFQLEPTMPVQKEQDAIFIPLPELEIPTQAATPEQASNNNPSPLPQTEIPQNAVPTEQPATQQPSGMETLQITKTSVNTTEEDASEITQHLHQVYTPRDKETVQHTEEDRMPTILFDDELAQQLEHQFLEEHKQQHPTKNDDSSEDDNPIQLSK